MSLGSKSSSRAKHKLRVGLESLVRQEIDEFVGYEPALCQQCGVELLCDGEWCYVGLCDKCEGDLYADDLWDDDGIDDYDYREDDHYDDYDCDCVEDYYDAEPVMNVGTFYRNKDGRVLLCCEIRDRKLFVDMLTGLEVSVNFYQVEMVA